MNIILIYVGFEVLTAVVMKIIIFWDVKLCSLLSCNRRCSSETSVATQETIQGHIPEDDTLHHFNLFSSFPSTCTLLHQLTSCSYTVLKTEVYARKACIMKNIKYGLQK
jgi:hypothetical protein